MVYTKYKPTDHQLMPSCITAPDGSLVCISNQCTPHSLIVTLTCSSFSANEVGRFQQGNVNLLLELGGMEAPGVRQCNHLWVSCYVLINVCSSQYHDFLRVNGRNNLRQMSNDLLRLTHTALYYYYACTVGPRLSKHLCVNSMLNVFR